MIKTESNEEYFFKITDLNSGNVIDMFFDGTKLELNFDYVERDIEDVGSWAFRGNDNISLFITKEEDYELYEMFSLIKDYLYTWDSEDAKENSNQLNIIKDDEAVAIELEQKTLSFDRSIILKEKYTSLLTFMNAFVVYFYRKEKEKKLIKR